MAGVSFAMKLMPDGLRAQVREFELKVQREISEKRQELLAKVRREANLHCVTLLD